MDSPRLLHRLPPQGGKLLRVAVELPKNSRSNFQGKEFKVAARRGVAGAARLLRRGIQRDRASATT